MSAPRPREHDSAGNPARSIKDGFWSWIPNAVFDHYGAIIGPMGLLMYATLCRALQPFNRGEVTVERLAHWMMTTAPTVRKHLAVLEDAGLITLTASNRRGWYDATLVQVEAFHAEQVATETHPVIHRPSPPPTLDFSPTAPTKVTPTPSVQPDDSVKRRFAEPPQPDDQMKRRFSGQLPAPLSYELIEKNQRQPNIVTGVEADDSNELLGYDYLPLIQRWFIDHVGRPLFGDHPDPKLKRTVVDAVRSMLQVSPVGLESVLTFRVGCETSYLERLREAADPVPVFIRYLGWIAERYARDATRDGTRGETGQKVAVVQNVPFRNDRVEIAPGLFVTKDVPSWIYPDIIRDDMERRRRDAERKAKLAALRMEAESSLTGGVHHATP